MVWGTDSCDYITYANITSGGWPGCATASDGRVTCDLEPRPGCCYERLHAAAGAFVALYCLYGPICFICLLELFRILLSGVQCDLCEASEVRTAAAAAASAATAAASAAAARTLDDAAAAARAQ